MLASMGLPPPRRVFGHGFLTKDGQKMGKSLGNVLDPFGGRWLELNLRCSTACLHLSGFRRVTKSGTRDKHSVCTSSSFKAADPLFEAANVQSLPGRLVRTC
jgi:hypothetical protein